jgi:hypothetical protein
MSEATKAEVDDERAEELARSLVAWLDASNDGAPLVKPGHRIKLRWPPHPVSYAYHVMNSDWRGSAVLETHGERLPVQVARTPHGVFGRCEPIWLEARGKDEAEMLERMRTDAEPYFLKMLSINAMLERPGRFTRRMADLAPLDLLKLLFTPDRDIADDAQIEIEKHGSSHLYTQALIEILRNRTEPYRRSAQWCVLDLFEELPTYCRDTAQEKEAVAAIKELIWDAEDDYARTIFKAGVVIGGHLSDEYGGPVLLECLDAPSKIGRRSAIHGLFHVVEWVPEMRETVVTALLDHAGKESEPLLAEFSRGLAHDIEESSYEHVEEPKFPGE